MTEPAEGVRLQKVLAAAGIASRRACEVLISEGRVEVNSEIVVEQGRRVDPEHDVIRVDGARIPPPRRHRYLALNKPRGVVATMQDPEGRRTVADLLVEVKVETDNICSFALVCYRACRISVSALVDSFFTLSVVRKRERTIVEDPEILTEESGVESVSH